MRVDVRDVGGRHLAVSHGLAHGPLQPRVCFRLPGAEIGFFRLGNECDTYASLNYGANLGEVDGTGFKAVFTMAYGTQQLANWEQSTPAWRQAYVEASDIGASLNAPALRGASLWAGVGGAPASSSTRSAPATSFTTKPSWAA